MGCQFSRITHPISTVGFAICSDDSKAEVFPVLKSASRKFCPDTPHSGDISYNISLSPLYGLATCPTCRLNTTSGYALLQFDVINTSVAFESSGSAFLSNVLLEFGGPEVSLAMAPP
jgi:hypothetical protein